MIIFLLALAAVCGLIAFRGGLSNVARGRKYKSGTGFCVWRWTDVRSEYILRLHVFKTPWCALCLHWIRKADPEPWLHDHPVSFLSFILRGGYAEVRQRPFEPSPSIMLHKWFNVIRAEKYDRHKILLVRPRTLTICFMGPKTREWGYHTTDGWIGWKEYERLQKEDGEKLTWPKFFEGLNKRVDDLSEKFIASYDAKLFVDEETRRISTVDGDFDDEAPTEPRPYADFEISRKDFYKKVKP